MALKKFSDLNGTSSSSKTKKEVEVENILNDKIELGVRVVETEPVKKTEPKQTNENDQVVKTIGKIARFPKNVQAHHAFNFLENVKIPKNNVWYIMVEKQDSELQMVKYNYNEGVDLYQFIRDLKKHYLNEYNGSDVIREAIEMIEIDGNDTYSKIMNISKVVINGKPLITKITEDLINLLAK